MRVTHLSGSTDRSEASVGSFVANLPELLGSMVVDPRCLVVIAEFSDGRYVQFWVERDRTLIAEVVSNLYLRDVLALSVEDEDALRRDGWGEPSPGPNPNWHVTTRGDEGLWRVVTMVRRVVYDVLGERRDGRVHISMWCHQEVDGTSSDERRTQSRVRYQQALTEIRAALEGD